MTQKHDRGFSLIELLLVVVVIGIVAAIGVPAYQRGIAAAEHRSLLASMKSASSTQTAFFSQNNRYGRLAEINGMMGNGLGAVSGNRLIRNQFVLEMVPANPTDTELRNGFTINASRDDSGITYRFQLTESGRVMRVLPGPEAE